MEIVLLGLGANMNEPLHAIRRAVDKIGKIEDTTLLETSSIYNTTPVSSIAQDNYLNAACKIQTKLSPLLLLEKLQEIETEIGKVPKQKDAPRIIDIDILFFGTKKIDLTEITIPHKEAFNRLFVLTPLADIIDTLQLPEGSSVSIKELIKNFSNPHNETVTLYKEVLL